MQPMLPEFNVTYSISQHWVFLTHRLEAHEHVDAHIDQDSYYCRDEAEHHAVPAGILEVQLLTTEIELD